MKGFRFSLTAALVKRRAERERAEHHSQQARQALDAARATAAEIDRKLQHMRLRLRAARLALTEPSTTVEDPATELVRCGRVHATLAGCHRLQAAIAAATREVTRRQEQLSLRLQDERRCNDAVRALDDLEARERRLFLRARERRADMQRVDDALLRWQPRGPGVHDERP